MQLWSKPGGPLLYVDAEDAAHNNQTAYMNHQCDPNCESEHHNLDGRPVVKIIATKDIASGGELTFNYRYEVDDDGGGFPCTCGGDACQRWVGRRANRANNGNRKRPIDSVDE